METQHDRAAAVQNCGRIARDNSSGKKLLCVEHLNLRHTNRLLVSDSMVTMSPISLSTPEKVQPHCLERPTSPRGLRPNPWCCLSIPLTKLEVPIIRSLECIDGPERTRIDYFGWLLFECRVTPVLLANITQLTYRATYRGESCRLIEERVQPAIIKRHYQRESTDSVMLRPTGEACPISRRLPPDVAHFFAYRWS